MRFLYIGPFRFPNGDAAASRVLNNIRILKAIGHEVDVLSFGGKYLERDKTSQGEYEHDGIPYIITNDIDTHTWKERIRRYFLPPKKAWRIIYRNIDSYDVIITYNPSWTLNIPLIKLCKKYNKKTILDLTEWYSSKDFPGGKWTPLYWLSELNMIFIQKKYKNIIPISTFLSRYYSSIHQIVIPPLISCNDDKWMNYIEDIPLAIKEFNGRKIIFAGTPAKKDLLANILQAGLSLIKSGLSIQFIILGIDNVQSKSFFSSNEYKSYNNNFIFLGRKPQEEVPAYYKLADFSAIIREPNRKNTAGFPTKMAESMASGCPVLLNATSDLSDFVKDMENAILINDFTIDSIKIGLRRISLLSDEQINKMKQNARKVAWNKFDYHQYLVSVKQFIQKIQ